ncbi:serine/threonine protein kinase [Entomohabitans teleogrylli]|uniref:serine/threonine protein kinase n=1 Tax=Entomohabitans teleogrylli TaxID=1384589 RepID=UPI00073D1C46|nr:serine/threonine-protein kinase [Entomohabitans teleogrylli]
MSQQTTGPHARHLPPGYRFSEFEIRDVIGEGGFGIVYRATDHQLERTIAIKEYMPDQLALRRADHSLALRGERLKGAFDAGLSSFIQEARLLARFSHPGLVQVLRFWEQNGTAYMGTQYYSGTTLKKRHQQQPGKINETWIRRILPPLFSAIETLHHQGYLHCDISLDNIQIQDNQMPVLLDFGSARKAIGNVSDTTEMMLKPGFAPFELYTDSDEGDRGAWTDIYSLGAVLHTLVAGAPPPVSVVRSIEDNYQPLMTLRPPGYSAELLYAIDQSLALKPQHRPQSLRELADLLRLPIAGTPDTAPSAAAPTAPAPATSPSPAAPREVSRRWPLIAGAGAALALIAAVALWLMRPGDPVPSLPDPQIAGASPTIPPGDAPVNAAQVAPAAPPTAPIVESPPTPQAQAQAQAQPDNAPIAVVYFAYSPGQQVTLNGLRHDVSSDHSGTAKLRLAAGDHLLEVTDNGGSYRHTLSITTPGTYLLGTR